MGLARELMTREISILGYLPWYRDFLIESLRDSAQYGIYFLPTSRQYNVVLPSQNRKLFLLYTAFMD